jgi:shikimate kinase
MKSNIALIGFMGAGKSTIGRAVARKLRMDFVETDALAEERAGKSVSVIFSSDGEAAFRSIESEVTEAAALKDGTVISCGGGIVLNPLNIEHLRTKATIVYLQADPHTVWQRITLSSEIRPLLQVGDTLKTIEDLLRYRQPLYRDAADIIIETSGRGVNDIVNDLMMELSKNAGLNL